MKNLYRVNFVDGDSFLGGDLTNHKWDEVPYKKITSIDYKLPNGKRLNLVGYEKYFFMVEATIDLNGNRRGEVRPEYIYWIGIIDKMANIFKINLKNSYVEKESISILHPFIVGLNSKKWR